MYRAKYRRWPLSLFPFSGTAPGRTYPTPPGGVVQNQELSLGGQQSGADVPRATWIWCATLSRSCGRSSARTRRSRPGSSTSAASATACRGQGSLPPAGRADGGLPARTRRTPLGSPRLHSPCEVARAIADLKDKCHEAIVDLQKAAGCKRDVKLHVLAPQEYSDRARHGRSVRTQTVGSASEPSLCGETRRATPTVAHVAARRKFTCRILWCASASPEPGKVGLKQFVPEAKIYAVVQNASLQDLIGTGICCIPGQLGRGGAGQTIAEADGQPQNKLIPYAGANLVGERPSTRIGELLRRFGDPDRA